MGQVVSSMSGCRLLNGGTFDDRRGSFAKVLSSQLQQTSEIKFKPRELFWSKSVRGVIRGMHFQLPPYSGSKLVWVSKGLIRDVILDLRTKSGTFGNCLVNEMDESLGGLYIPAGCAHGFEVLSDIAIVNYAQEVDYFPAFDTGIAWNSFNFDWKSTPPIMSERDLKLPAFSDFESPFSDETTP